MTNWKNNGSSLIKQINFWLNRLNKVLKIVLVLFVIAIIVELISLYNKRVSPIDKKETIVVESPYYLHGINAYEEHDYSSAEENLLLALEQTTNEKGKKTLETAEICVQLGALYMRMDMFETGYDYVNSAYTTFKELLGDDYSNTIQAKCLIAQYDMCMDNYSRALSTFYEAYEETRYFYNKVDIGLCIAQCYRELGDYENANIWYNELITYYNKSGTLDLTYINLLNECCLYSIEIEDDELAINGFLNAISLWESLNIPEDATIANVYANLSSTYFKRGNYHEGERYAEKAMTIWEELYGSDSMNLVNIYMDMSDRYKKNLMFDEAKNILDRALKIVLSSVGENHTMAAEIYNRLGIFYGERGMFRQSAESYLHAVEIRKNLLGGDYIYDASVYINLSECYGHLREYEKSLEFGLESIRIFEAFLGSDNTRTASAYTSIAWTYANMGNLEKAMQRVNQALEIYEKNESLHNLDVAYAYQTAGYIYTRYGQYEPAKEYLIKALEMFMDISGKNTLNVFDICLYLGDIDIIYEKSYDSAAEYYKQSYAILNELSLEDTTYSEQFNESVEMLYETSNLKEAFDQWLDDWIKA